MQAKSPLDALVEQYLARIAHVKSLIASLQKALDQSPELRPAVAAELKALLGKPEAEPEDEPEQDADDEPTTAAAFKPIPSGGETPLRDRMKTYFLSRNNKPASIEDIWNDVGGAINSVRGMLYKANRNNGDFIRVPKDGDMDDWRLAEKHLGAGQSQLVPAATAIGGSEA